MVFALGFFSQRAQPSLPVVLVVVGLGRDLEDRAPSEGVWGSPPQGGFEVFHRPAVPTTCFFMLSLLERTTCRARERWNPFPHAGFQRFLRDLVVPFSTPCRPVQYKSACFYPAKVIPFSINHPPQSQGDAEKPSARSGPVQYKNYSPFLGGTCGLAGETISFPHAVAYRNSGQATWIFFNSPRHFFRKLRTTNLSFALAGSAPNCR